MRRFVMPFVLAVGLVAAAVGGAAAYNSSHARSVCPYCSADHCPFQK